MTVVRWIDGTELVHITSGPARLGTDNEETLNSVAQDTPWYDVRRIEEHRLVPNVPAFRLSRFPVTCSQYAAFLNEAGAVASDGWAVLGDVGLAADVRAWLDDRSPEEHGHGVGVVHTLDGTWEPAPTTEALPMTLVTWFGAVAYAGHYGARLPTEVEWEKSARGPEGLVFPWGNTYIPGVANLSDHWMGTPVETQAQWDQTFWQEGRGTAWLASRPTKSGAFPGGASPYGCVDMIGNVAEWCSDLYDATVEGGRSDFRAMRGAGRYGYTAIARCATRRRRAPESVSENLGFRIAVDIDAARA